MKAILKNLISIMAYSIVTGAGMFIGLTIASRIL